MRTQLIAYRVSLLTTLWLLLSAGPSFAQSTAFTYQGKLTDNGIPANAAYDMQFKLFDAAVNGNQIGTTLTFDGTGSNPPSVAVSNGIFMVSLDFGGAALSGADRFLEINVRPAGNPGGYQQLLPRQKLTSAAYAVQAINATTATNATQLGGLTASQYVVTSDVRLSDARQPLAGSTNYIQNAASQQASSNFNISGNGTVGGTLSANAVSSSIFNISGNGTVGGTLSANAVTSTTQFNIGGFRVLSRQGNENIFVGAGTGQSNTTGGGNSFVGANAGFSNTTGSQNSFFGNAAGADNLTGANNSFFGFAAGNGNNAGTDNAFFGANAGSNNTASFNSFFGSRAGDSSTSGTKNAFFGYNAGQANQTGNDNSFFGYNAGSLTTFSGNSFFGNSAGRNNTSGGHNSFFGDAAGSENTTGCCNAFFGSEAGLRNSTGHDNTFIGESAGESNLTGSNNIIIGSFADVGSGNLDHATAIGANSVASLSNSIYLGRADGSDAVRIPGPVVIDGSLVVGTLGSAGSTSICLNIANRIAPCSSSLRYKTNVQPFTDGLDVVRRLRPIAFEWKEGGMRDIGFAAEQVHEIAPLLTTANKDGQIEGVKYGQLTTVLVNAVKEQQSQIEAQKQQLVEQQKLLQQQQQQNQAQQNQLRRQQQQFAALKKLVCSSHRRASVCQ